MSQLKPFKAFRPRPELAAQVASVPYDVVNSAEARVLADGNPYSFLHVCRPEIDLPDSTDIHADAVYAQGVRALHRMIQDGTLVQEPEACLYIYQQRMGDHVQAGLVGLCSVKEYETGAIKRHEYTRQDKEDDRTRHVTEQAANAEPVFLAYRAVPYIDSLIDKIRVNPPVYDVVTPDGIGHTVWVVSEETHIYTINHLFDAVPADWKHRLAALDCVALHCNAKKLNAELAAAIKAAGYGLMCWTVNEPAQAQQLLDWGVDAICTDRLDLFKPE